MQEQNRDSLKADTSASHSGKNTRTLLIAELVKTSVLALSACAAIVLGTIAWFSSNTRVASGGVAISHQYDTIRLATRGVRQTAEEKLLGLPPGETLSSDDPDSPYFFTETGTIALRLDGDGVSVRPGFSGKVTFYIIPKRTGRLETTLYLKLAGYREYTENGGTKARPVEDDVVLDALLEGHILLFQDGEHPEWLRPENGSVLHISEDVDVGIPLPVTFYWYWPLRYKDMDEAWLDRVLTKPLPTTPEYRYNRVFIAKADDEENQQQTLKDDKLCDEAYNRADEYIGSHADFLYLSIQASLTEEPTS